MLVGSDNAKADFNSLADAAHTEMISNRLDEAFDEMIANLNKERDSAKSSLNGLTKQQQEELAGFWTGIITLMSELAKKMAALYAEILNKIRAGWKITREELNEFFSKTKEKVHKVFVQQPAQCSMGRFHFTFQIK